MRTVLNLILFFLFTACANPINRVTFDNYAGLCSQAEQRQDLTQAEAACYRAVVNVTAGNLGLELKSQSLYNLARIKRRLAKFKEAEELLKESLAIEEKVTSKESLNSGRRLVELAVNLAAQNRVLEGAPFLLQVVPIAKGFVGQERQFIILSYENYISLLKSLDQNDLARQFEQAAISLK